MSVLRRGLSLRAREMAALTVLTLCAVALTTIVHLHHSRLILWTATLREADLVARQIYSLSADALSRPNAPEPWTAIRQSREVRALLDASVGYAPWLLDIVIVDQAGRAVVHSDVAREGQPVSPRPSLRGLVASGAFERLWTMHQSDRIYDVSLPFDLDRKPFGTIRVGTALPLVQGELDNALRYSVVLGVIALVAALAVGLALSSFTLRPMRKLAEDMERLRRGEFDVGSDAAPRDEFGKLAYQLQLLGRQIQTDRTRAQAERSRFQTAVDQLEDGLMLWSADGRVLFANRAVEAAVGRPAAELVGEPFDRALPEGHPLRPMVVAAIQDNETSRNVRVDIPGTGEPVQLLASVFPVADDRATCDGAILVLRDVRTVAVSARTFQSLIQYSAQLAALGQVTAEVTHDVKNPLHAMMLHVAFLRERLPTPPEDVRRSLETLEAEIRRADSLLTRFHESTRPSEVSLKPLDVNALLQEVATILGADWESRGVRFELDLDRSLPPVLGDEEMLRRAIMNVALNACQAMPEGGLVRLISEREDGALARVTVSDTGVGVSPDDLDRIFSAYYTTKPGGSGIGLALVRRVVEMHNGAIDVVSTVGQGTSFIVRVPLHAGS